MGSSDAGMPFRLTDLGNSMTVTARPHHDSAGERSAGTIGRQHPTSLLRAPLAALTDPRNLPAAPAALRPRACRVVHATDERVHLLVPALGTAAGQAAAEGVLKELRALPGVAWAVLNAPLASVVVGLDAPVDVDELAGTATAALPDRTPRARGTHPGDAAEPRWERVGLAAGLVGLPASAAGWVARRLPLTGQVAGLVSLLDLQPALRTVAGGVLDHGPGRAARAVVTSTVQAAAGGVSGLLVDTCTRALRVRAADARLRAWTNREPDLAADPESAAAEWVGSERPVPLPDGSTEAYLRRSGLLAGVGFVAWLPWVGGRNAAAVAVSAVPKSAACAAEGFARTLATGLADRGALIRDPGALDRLARVTTLVVDTDVLHTGRRMLADLTPTGRGSVPTENLIAAAYRLFDPDHPHRDVAHEDWALRPGQAPDELVLANAGTTVATVRVVAEPVATVRALAAAARRSGLRVLLAGDPAAGGQWGAASERAPGGSGLVATVRELQASGEVVLTVSGRPAALGAADVGVGVHRPGDRPPWAAHVLLGADLSAAALLVDAAGAARRTARRGVRLAQLASGLGVLSAWGARGRGGTGLWLVNGAALVGLAGGVRSARNLLQRPLDPPISPLPWHAMPTQTVLGELGTGRDGLSAAEARRRHRRRTRPGGTAMPSLPAGFLSELDNPLTPILAAGAAVSAATGARTDALIVAASTVLCAAVGAAQRLGADRALAGLMSATAPTARVVRDGVEAEVDAAALVPGDVVRLDGGAVVPADCRVLDALGLEVDESALTGESLPVPKSAGPVLAAAVAERSSMLHEGTTIAAGTALAVVVAVGSSTEMGAAAAAAPLARDTVGVAARLSRLTRVTVPVALGSAAAVVGAGIAHGRPIRRSVHGGVALAVASVPEGLPFLVSAAQLACARRLGARQALVRDPRTIEALGRADVLCFDKTGTLTEGRISLVGVHAGTETRPVGSLRAVERQVLAAALRATPAPENATAFADQTDSAVTTGAAAAGVDRGAGSPHLELRFEPSRGFHAVLTRPPDAATGLLSVKGSPEALLERCTGCAGEAMSARTRRRLLDRAATLAGQGRRILAVAERGGVDTGGGELVETDIAGLTFLGFLVLADPPRIGAAPALARLRRAGVQTVMMTGDHPQTAATIAADLGILNSHRVITGPDLDAMSDEELDGALRQVAVIARGTPAHKVRVVEAFRRIGATVAMTGDGANDAPAIRMADVGIAVGAHASPAARAAADLVISDGRLETVVEALVEGRGMWGSVRAGLAILLGGNLGEIAFTVIGALLTGSAPLTARQMLLVNLLTDLAPAVSVAMRPVEADAETLLREGPEASLGSALNRQIMLRAATTTAAATGAWITASLTGRPARARTVALVALVGAQLGQTVAEGGRSRPVLAATAVSAAILIGIVQTPGVSWFFGCTPLGPVGWSTALSWATGTTLTTAGATRLVRALPHQRQALRAAA
jgi:magnesium-transporting ATPase (P-type)